MSILFLDLETTGLPDQIGYNQYYSYTKLEKYNSSRIVQLALLVYANGKLRKIHNYIVKPDDFKIHNAVMHHIDQKTADRVGIAFEDISAYIRKDLIGASLLVAHNVQFDKNVLLSELFRHGLHSDIKLLEAIPTFCTSTECTNITKIKMINGYKQPKLSELYYFLFGEHATGLHDALQDTKIMMKCFFALIDKGYFSI